MWMLATFPSKGLCSFYIITGLNFEVRKLYDKYVCTSAKITCYFFFKIQNEMNNYELPIIVNIYF